MKRFPIILTVCAAAAFAILVALGVWQLERLRWKTDLLARVAAAQTAAAVPAPPVLARAAQGADVDYARVTLACPTLERTAAVKLYALQDGVAGWRLITACPLGAGGAYDSVLVDRGFVADEQLGDLPAGQVLTAPVTGVLRAAGEGTSMVREGWSGSDRWFKRDAAGMGAALAAGRTAPVFLMLESPAPAAGLPRPLPLPTGISNNHLTYALTWFGLAGALAAVYAAVLRARFRPIAAPPAG